MKYKVMCALLLWGAFWRQPRSMAHAQESCDTCLTQNSGWIAMVCPSPSEAFFCRWEWDIITLDSRNHRSGVCVLFRVCLWMFSTGAVQGSGFEFCSVHYLDAHFIFMCKLSLSKPLSRMCTEMNTLKTRGSSGVRTPPSWVGRGVLRHYRNI